MVTKEWAAVHRKHHAKCDTADDPHSPQVLGLNRVLWGGVFLYVKESRKPETLERYGHGTPDDWLERHIYSKRQVLGLTLMGTIDVILFGLVPGALILGTQIVMDPVTLRAVIDCRYDVLARYAKSLKRIYYEELGKLKQASPGDARKLQAVEPRLDRDEKTLRDRERAQFAEALPKTHDLYTAYSMRRDLAALWARSTASRDQLIGRLQDWCQRAEASGIRPLVDFAQRLQSYS